MFHYCGDMSLPASRDLNQVEGAGLRVEAVSRNDQIVHGFSNPSRDRPEGFFVSEAGTPSERSGRIRRKRRRRPCVAMT